MERLIKIFLIVVFLFLSCPAWSATYYVCSSGCNDENDGTSTGQCVASITRAHALAGSNDTVNFCPAGTWTGTLILTAEAGVTYIGDDSSTWGSGTRAKLQATGTTAQVALISVSTVTFKGFDVDMNGQDAGGLYIKATDASNNISNITVDNCEIHGSAAANWAYGLYVGGWGTNYARDVSNVTIKNTSVHDTQHEAITIYPSWTGGVLNTATNITVRNCTTYNTGRNDTNHYFDIGIMIANRVIGGVFEFNVCYGSLGGILVTNSGYGTPGDPTNIHIRYNILRNNTSGNYPYGLGFSTDSNVGPLSYASIYAYGNLIHSNGGSGILFAADYGASTVYLYNNTIYQAGGTAGIKLWSTFSGTDGTYELKNNIINTTNVPAIAFDVAADASFFTHNNNLIYRSSANTDDHVVVGGTTYDRDGTASDLTNWEATAQKTDPAFIGNTLPTGFTGTYGTNMVPNTDYFQLTVDSPAKDAGATLASYTGSINGAGLATPITRPLGDAFDIGAYEYGTVAQSGGSAGQGFKLQGVTIR